MQTFLPYSSYQSSSFVLDRQRLGKQRVETKQILLALTQPEYGWKNHPAVKMWRGYEYELCEYGICMCREWICRGYEDSLYNFFAEEQKKYEPVTPVWLGNKEFHNSHRSNLLRKDPEYYKQFEWDVPDNLPYIWPVTN